MSMYTRSVAMEYPRIDIDAGDGYISMTIRDKNVSIRVDMSPEATAALSQALNVVLFRLT